MGRLIFTVLAALAGWAVWRWLQGQEASSVQPPMPTTQPPPANRRPQAPAERSPAPADSTAPAQEAPQSAVATEEAKPATDEQPLSEEQPGAVEVESRPAANGVVPIAEPEPAGASQLEPIEAYCMRCKEQRAIVDAHEEVTANGRRALRGTCSVCGAKMFRFLPDRE
jgi:hypothetical protein